MPNAFAKFARFITTGIGIEERPRRGRSRRIWRDGLTFCGLARPRRRKAALCRCVRSIREHILRGVDDSEFFHGTTWSSQNFLDPCDPRSAISPGFLPSRSLSKSRDLIAARGDDSSRIVDAEAPRGSRNTCRREIFRRKRVSLSGRLRFLYLGKEYRRNAKYLVDGRAC